MSDDRFSVSSGADLSAAIKDIAYRLGFSVCGIVPIGVPLHVSFFERWLGLGRHMDMGYLARFLDRRRDPARLDQRSGVLRSMVVVGFDYGSIVADPALAADPSRGLIARYAWMPDYHDFMRSALYELDGYVRSLTGRRPVGKALVDTGPVLERDVALAAGVGFTGKNCCTIQPELGSWLLLGTLSVPEVMAYDNALFQGPGLDVELVLAGAPPSTTVGMWSVASARGQGVVKGTCAGCTRCLRACPTDAFVGPFHLDPARCISYWTIESRAPIPRELRSQFGNRVFGCDVCQDVCPWNRRGGLRPRPFGLATAWPERVAPRLLNGFVGDRAWLDEDAFRRRYARTAILRAGRVGMLRNVCVALGNWAHVDTVAALGLALEDSDPLPRGHAAWALGRVGVAHGRDVVGPVLLAALERESVDWVRAELVDAVDLLGLVV